MHMSHNMWILRKCHFAILLFGGGLARCLEFCLNLSVQKSHFEMCKLIIENVRARTRQKIMD